MGLDNSRILGCGSLCSVAIARDCGDTSRRCGIGGGGRAVHEESLRAALGRAGWGSYQSELRLERLAVRGFNEVKWVCSMFLL